MKILIVSALYPPEVNSVATHCKELAIRLKKANHNITVLTYATLPEESDAIKIIKISKQLPRALRLVIFFMKLVTVAHKTDIIYVENGASTELPIVIASVFMRTPFIIHVGDKRAHDIANKNAVLKWIQNMSFKRATGIIKSTPLVRPEILPFSKVSNEEITKYENSWEMHLKDFEVYSKHE